MGTEVAHVTRDPDTTFKVKGQGHQAALLAAALTREAGAAGDRENVLGVGNYCYVASARRRARRWGAHGGERRAGVYCVATRTACMVTVLTTVQLQRYGEIVLTIFEVSISGGGELIP